VQASSGLSYSCGSVPLSFGLGLLLGFDRLYDLLDFLVLQFLYPEKDLESMRVCSRNNRKERKTYSLLSITLHNSDFNVLGSSLDHLQQTLDGQSDRVIPGQVLLVVLFQELSDSFRRSPYSRTLCLSHNGLSASVFNLMLKPASPSTRKRYH
jgi:hypothetical protein